MLDGLAATAARRDRPETAARLLGTADALRSSIGTPRPPCERDQYESAVAAVTAALGVDRYADLASVPRPERMLTRLAAAADWSG